MEERSSAVKLGSPLGVPLSQDTPGSSRARCRFPEPLCSPIAASGSPQMLSSPGAPPFCPSPSPASKKVIGLSNNARNNIYMKTLMNSPYHKSYTPMSATPGPAYQTPLRAKPNSPHPAVSTHPASPHVNATSTPQGTRMPGSGRKIFTPKNIVLNPFESDVDNLHFPAYMSPGFFTAASTPASEERKVFRWSIEHIAELNPADIDGTASHQTHSTRLDRETEERAQRAIEQFFANNLIVPSPWSDPQKPKKKNILPATPNAYGASSGPPEELMTELQGSIQKSLPAKQGTVDASCQTVLSLPMDLDLQSVLGAYMTQDNDEGNQVDMLSTSSLRRKLFFHGDTSSLAPSPVKGLAQDIESPKPMEPNFDRFTPLKNTPAFSSSPIRSYRTPRRCSSDPEFLASPELSPIVHGSLNNESWSKSKRKSRSSGLFEPGREEIDLSPVVGFDAQLRHSPVSPIPFGDLSTDDKEDVHPRFEDSPGFSPVRPVKTQIRKILRKSQEESYIQEDVCDSEEEVESMTPVSASQHLTSTSLTPVQSISPINQPVAQHLAAITANSVTDLQMKNMEFDPVPHEREHILTSSLCDTRDFTSSVDYQDDTHQQTSLCNQDTGYQTASLQSTNPESVSLHTNLTNQFGAMPFNLTNQESVFQTSSLSINQDKPPVLSLTAHFSMISSQKDSDDEEDVFKIKDNFSGQMFPKQKLLFVDEDDEELDIHDTPKHTVPFKPKFDDSALPEDISTDHGHMEVDRLSDTDCVSSQEKIVLTRARQALAMANSRYPQDGDKGVAGTGFTAETGREVHVGQPSIDVKEKKCSASELAYSILQRAGEDLARYGAMIPSKKSREVTMEGVHDYS